MEDNKKDSNQSTIVCKVCNKEKVRIRDLDRRRSDRGFKYVNEHGFLFHGRTCPDCHSKSVYRKYEKPAREAAKEEKKKALTD